MCVRKPASRSRNSRSRPTAPPRTAARASRRSDSSQESDGTLAASSIQSLLLELADPLDPGRAEVEQLVELVTGERGALRRRLYLHEPPRAGHDDVQVDLRARVLLVVEVEQLLAADDPERDRADGIGEDATEAGLVECPRGGDVRAADRRAARAAVGLEDVAVEPERPLAQRLQVGHRSQGPADQPLDLDGAALLLARARLALAPLSG